MILLTQLLGTQFIQFSHLTTQVLRVRESFSEKHDLSNQTVIRHHHGYRTKQHLQVIRKFSTSRVTWIHGDEYAQIGVEVDVLAEEGELHPLFKKSLSDGLDLLSDD